MTKETTRKYIRQAIIIVVSMIIGSIITIIIRDTDCKPKKTSISNGGYSEFEPLYETYEILRKNYYEDVDTSKLIDGAIDGMMNSLGDKHSMYFNKENKKEFDSELSGTYYGIGAEIQLNEDSTISIKKIFDDSPADVSGLKPDDIILSVDGKTTKGKNASEVASMLKSSTVKTATILVKRGEEEKEFKVKKANVTMFSVSSEVINKENKNIGYISVSIFGEKTYTQFLAALNKLEDSNIDSLIIDLRGNSGGYLSTVTNMLDIFIDRDNVIYKMQTQKGIIGYKTSTTSKKDYEIILLVDENSASASEIMAAAMKEVYGAKLVGTKTYGKGTVQTTSDLSNGTMIKYTIEKWLTPNGNSIDGEGISPDYEVSLDEEYKKSPSNETDNQLQKALDLLK